MSPLNLSSAARRSIGGCSQRRRARRRSRDLDLPGGDARELIVDRDRVYALNGEESHVLAAVGAFRVVPEREFGTDRDDRLDRDTLDHLRAEG